MWSVGDVWFEAKWFRLVLNGTNPVLFRSDFSVYFESLLGDRVTADNFSTRELGLPHSGTKNFWEISRELSSVARELGNDHL